MTLQLAHSLGITVDRGHRALASVNFPGNGSPLREDRLRFHLLTYHQDLHLNVKYWFVAVFDVVHDSFLGHLVASHSPSHRL